MKTISYTCSLLAAIALTPMILRAEDPVSPGKASTSTTTQQPVKPEPVTPAATDEKDKDPGKTSTTTTAPSRITGHSDAAAGNDAPAAPKKDSAAKSGDNTAAAGEAKDAAAGAPVEGNNGSVGGTKASK